jgi:hypothetical protein
MLLPLAEGTEVPVSSGKRHILCYVIDGDEGCGGRRTFVKHKIWIFSV